MGPPGPPGLPGPPGKPVSVHPGVAVQEMLNLFFHLCNFFNGTKNDLGAEMPLENLKFSVCSVIEYLRVSCCCVHPLHSTYIT